MRVSDDEIRSLRAEILEKIDLTRDLEDEEVYLLIEEYAGRFSREKLLTLKERGELEQLLFNSLRKLDVLQELLEDEECRRILEEKYRIDLAQFYKLNARPAYYE